MLRLLLVTLMMTCFLLLKHQNQQRITSRTTASINNLRPQDLPHHRHVFSQHRTQEKACCIVHPWASRSSTPPTSCWRRFHAPWSSSLSLCSSWQRLSRSLWGSRCSSSGRRLRFSETSQAERSRSCTTNWTDDRRYSNREAHRDAKLYNWLHSWPSGAGIFMFLWTSLLVTVLFDSALQVFKLYL